MSEQNDDEIEIKPAGSRLFRHFGSITPKHRSEDFKALREAFEQGVADEILSETAREDGG